ncbi:hypothetical protein, partial [Proteus mirabilis]|uniref:hypothetical protein n=1 Tax=Proteus mirabilis TaxID=584 RepID=UPI00195389D1
LTKSSIALAGIHGRRGRRAGRGSAPRRPDGARAHHPPQPGSAGPPRRHRLAGRARGHGQLTRVSD